MSYAVYGGHQHPANELNLAGISKKAVYSPRNQKMQEVRTYRLFGFIKYDTQAEIVAAIRSLETDYAVDGQDFRFYLDDGTIAHSLLNGSDCISGVKVIQPPFFPEGDGVQLATYRSYSVTLQGTYDASESDLVSWEETIETQGDGGPISHILDTVVGPFQLFTSLTSAQYYVQTGRAIGYLAYPAPPPPANPDGLFGFKTKIRKKSARQLGRGLRFYPIEWTYFMGRDVSRFGPIDLIPTSQ